MVIKVSTLLANNTDVVADTSPSLGGPLVTNNFPIENNGAPVTITGNEYPLDSGQPGQVLTTDGAGELSWQDAGTSVITLVGAVTGSGASPVTTTITPTGVIVGSYGSSSAVAMFTVNNAGQLTSATTAPISITPSQAGLGNVTNQLQVINAGGAPSVREGTGAPSGADTLGALYIDQSVANGNGLYRYNGVTWDVIATRPNLYNERVNGYVAPVAQTLDSVAIGTGAETAPTAVRSLAIGQQSLSRIPGGVVQASGRFASNGDAQTGRYMLRTHTISNLPTEMFVDGTAGSVRLNLFDDSKWQKTLPRLLHPVGKSQQ
jgi:hypothetical protein